jgi:hypothetical protein
MSVPRLKLHINLINYFRYDTTSYIKAASADFAAIEPFESIVGRIGFRRLVHEPVSLSVFGGAIDRINGPRLGQLRESQHRATFSNSEENREIAGRCAFQIGRPTSAQLFALLCLQSGAATVRRPVPDRRKRSRFVRCLPSSEGM